LASKRSAIGILFAIVLSACTAGPTLVQVAVPPDGVTQNIFFMTTRTAIETQDLFGFERAVTPSYGMINIGIPPTHVPGQLEVTNGIPDPMRDFYNAGVVGLNGLRAFVAAIHDRQKPIVVYIHGYNNTFAESTFRYTQIVHDIGRDVTAVHVSWASRGEVAGYVYDRDSAMIARDEVTDLLVALSTTGRRVTLAAHSMGSLVAVEVLRQLSLTGERATLASLDRVILISPDLDADLFADQMLDVAYPVSDIMIAINRNDRALALSGQVSRYSQRVGRDLDPQQLEAAGFVVVDATRIEDGDFLGHFIFATSPTLLAMIRSFQFELR